jgi:hypothetical protein
MNAARVTKRIIFGDHTGTGDIPPEFNAYTDKVKDLSKFLTELEKHVGRYAKALHSTIMSFCSDVTVWCTSGLALSDYLIEMQNRQEFPKDSLLGGFKTFSKSFTV